MSESMEFPRDEYVSESIDLKSMLQEEMRMYPTEEEFRLSVTGLNRLYEDTQFELMIADFAQVAAEDYSDFVDKAPSQNKWENMFYVGGLFGLHLASTNLPGGLAERILGMDDAVIESMVEDKEGLERGRTLHILGVLDQIHEKEFDAGDTEVIEAAAYLYDSLSDESERYFFALGYRFAVDKMAFFSEVFDEYDYLTEDYEQA